MRAHRVRALLMGGQACVSYGAATPPYQHSGKFQAGGFHHRLRDGESYSQK
jgi:hypothetical protein